MRRAVLFALAVLLQACAGPAQRASAPPPQAAQAMVSAANPHAVEAGLNVLRAGGGAVDAAVAVQAVLGLVEPQSSGLGGGAFLVHYDAETKAVTAYNGREVAPMGATPDMFLGPDGKPLPFGQVVVSGRATGVPGAVAMLGEAHRAHGRRPWAALFGDGVRLADQGFAVSPRLAGMIAGDYAQAKTPDHIAYFSKPDGTRLKAGDTLRNPAYASTLRRIAADGPRALLQGSLGQAIVAEVREGALPGTMTMADLAAYRVKSAPALCRPWRAYTLCTANPPSSGVGLLQLMKLLEHTDIADRTPTDPQAWYLFAEASRLMYADRDRYVGDPAFVPVPVEGMLDPAYIARRAALIGPRAGPAPAGDPPGARPLAADRTLEPAGTTHFVVVDRWGDVVSMTTTVESIFGSGRMANGFFLNNQMTDFSFSPRDAEGRPAANAVAPGKHPRSSMSPTVVLDRQGRFVAALGSPGGNNIIAYNAKALVGAFDWELPLQEAFDLPNLIARGTSVVGEMAKMSPAVVQHLTERGLAVRSGGGEGSGLHGVRRREDGRLEGAADLRREGVARAQ